MFSLSCKVSKLFLISKSILLSTSAILILGGKADTTEHIELQYEVKIV